MSNSAGNEDDVSFKLFDDTSDIPDLVWFTPIESDGPSSSDTSMSPPESFEETSDFKLTAKCSRHVSDIDTSTHFYSILLMVGKNDPRDPWQMSKFGRGFRQIQHQVQQESRQILEWKIATILKFQASWKARGEHQMVAEGAKFDEYVRRVHAETREVQKKQKLKLMDLVMKEFQENLKKFWLDEADDPSPEMIDTDDADSE
jgi:hypothetical protein